MTNTDGQDIIEETGNEITYDEIGNPLTYYNGMEFKWTMGRRLESVKNGNTNVSYTYNVDGLRTSKTVNNVKYNYYWDGDKLTGQTWQGNTLYFYYDKDGNPIGFDLNNNNYYYVTNLQGDIIAILSSSNGLLAEYEYDAWGNCTILYDTNDIADINPLRYRGYYYDTDTNLYYLQSRYYDANIGRFINSDEAKQITNDEDSSILQFGLFIYCENNPIVNMDENGKKPQYWINGAVALSNFSIMHSTNTKIKFNCYTYALGYYNIIANPGYWSNDNNYNKFVSVNEVAKRVCKDLKKKGRNGKILKGKDNNPYYKTDKNHYLIAVRTTSKSKYLKKRIYDYHFMKRDKNNKWSFKAGKSNWVMELRSDLNPNRVSWDMYALYKKTTGILWWKKTITKYQVSQKNVYTSDIVYIVVSK